MCWVCVLMAVLVCLLSPQYNSSVSSVAPFQVYPHMPFHSKSLWGKQPFSSVFQCLMDWNNGVKLCVSLDSGFPSCTHEKVWVWSLTFVASRYNWIFLTRYFCRSRAVETMFPFRELQFTVVNHQLRSAVYRGYDRFFFCFQCFYLLFLEESKYKCNTDISPLRLILWSCK